MKANELLAMLTGGDRRSTGRSEEAAAEVLRDPSLFPALLRGLGEGDARVRMRCADAAEKVTRERPDLLQPHKMRVFTVAELEDQQEIRWHLAQMIPRLKLSGKERLRAASVFYLYLDDKSSIVKTFAMQALADLAMQDGSMQRDVLLHLERLTAEGTPAMRARGKRLLQQMKSGIQQPARPASGC